MFAAVAFMLLLGALACGDGEGRHEAGPDSPPTTARASDRSEERQPRVVTLSVEPRLPGDARTYEDRKDRLRVKLPADWHRASDRATGRVSHVADILLAVGTARIRPRPAAACSNAPDEPRVDVGPTDALIVVEEDVRARAELARERPRFRLLKQVAPPGESRRERAGVFPAWKCRNEVGISGLRAPPFADGGRVFAVTAIIGEAATRRTRSEVLGILQSLQPLR